MSDATTGADAPSENPWTPRCSVVVDPDGVVQFFGRSNMPQDGATSITEEQYQAIKAAFAETGSAKFDGTTVTPYAPPVPPAAPTHVQKVDIWRRATDAEAEQLVALLDSQPVRLQRMFNDATVLSSDDEMWPTLMAGMAQLLGAERAAALLAPSTA